MILEKEIYEFTEHLKRKRLKAHTTDDYVRSLKIFLNFVNDNYPDIAEISDITKDIVLSYEKHLMTRDNAWGRPLSANRRRKFLASLKTFFLYLQKEERIYRNPALNVAFPRERKTIIKDVLTMDEMDRLLKYCSGHSLLSLRDRAVLELLYSTGIRADEICNIIISDIDFEERLLFVRKAKYDNERIIPFGESAGYWIKRYLEKARPLIEGRESDLLFVSHRGTKLNPDILCRMIKRWGKKAGIEKNVTTHTFRHSCGTHMLKGGADIRYVQRQLGHRQISTTEKYLKIEITDLKEIHDRCHPREQDDW